MSDSTLISAVRPSYAAAIAAGIRDRSYDTVRHGWVQKYGGEAVVWQPDGSCWHCVGFGPVGGPDWIDRDGRIEFTQIDPERGALLATALKCGEDPAPWGALADWLEERDLLAKNERAKYESLVRAANTKARKLAQSARMATVFASAIAIIDSFGANVILAHEGRENEEAVWSTQPADSVYPAFLATLGREGYRVVKVSSYISVGNCHYQLKITKS